MPINAGLINALMPQVRSVEDYRDDYTRRDIAQQGLQRNALLMQQAQQQQQEQQQAAAQEQQSHNALMQEVDRVSPGEDPRLQMMQRVAKIGGKPMDYLNAAMPSPKAPTRHVIEGNVVDIGPDNKPTTIYTAPPKPKLPPEAAQLVEYMLTLEKGNKALPYLEAIVKKMATQPAGTVINTYGSPVPFNLPDGSIGYAQPGNRAGAAPQVMAGPDGKPMTKPAGAEHAPSEGERKAATLLQRMRFSANQIAELTGGPGGAGMDTPDKLAAALSVLPGVGGVASRTANPQSRRIIEDAQLDVLDAALTLGTGAAYTKEQLEGYRKSYFPQIGDTPVDAKSKRERLANVLKAGETQAGRAAKGVPEFAPAAAAGSPAIPDAVAAALARHGGKK